MLSLATSFVGSADDLEPTCGDLIAYKVRPSQIRVRFESRALYVTRPRTSGLEISRANIRSGERSTRCEPSAS